MNRHLTDEELSAKIAGMEIEKAAAEHLATCISCSRQLAAMRQFVDTRRHEMAAEAPDWDAQREQVLARLSGASESRRRASWVRPALAAAAVVVAAVGVGVLQRPNPTVADPEIAVEEILAEAEELLGNDTIPGFEVIDPGIEELQGYYDNGVS